MRKLIGFVAVLVLACSALTADEKKEDKKPEDKKEKIDGKLLIGKWEPKVIKKGELTSLEFTTNGKLIAVAEVGGKEARAEGKYTLTDDKLVYEITFMGETVKETVTVVKLTNDELEGKDKEGKIEAFKRVKAK